MSHRGLFTVVGGLMMFYISYAIGYWSAKEGFDPTLLGPIAGTILFYFYGIKAMESVQTIHTLAANAAYCIVIGFGVEIIVLVFYMFYL